MFTIESLINEAIFQHEGFADNISEESNAATTDEFSKFGITQKMLSKYYGRAAFKYEVEALSEEVARDIYESHYYIAARINNLPKTIQVFIFDCALKHGVRRAIKFVQSVCNQAGYETNVSEDGAMGPNTRRASEWAEKMMGTVFLQALIEERRNFYQIIVEARPSKQAFLADWLKRLNVFEREIA